ncbi:MAG: branched-chain amino acid transaminase [Desulfobacterota bacterium]|nr:branched-chain amino acid transaminase [Thermodesulfobacteriota bacterium]MDW8002501.1 branched-chain amino acid transaminase [Deltaproteobacteria bacterium]
MRADKIWFDGKFVDWDKAQVHVCTHTLHYGLGVFEGIRCYECYDGRSAIFRLKEHIKRLYDSAHIVEIEIPYSQEEITEVCKEIVKINNFRECYIRPLVFIESNQLGLFVKEFKVRVAVISWVWGAYLGEEGLKNGIKAKISSFIRHHVDAGMTKAKVNGQYVNSILAKREAIACGYDEAIMLDTEGYVSEASGENVFIVRGNVIKTTPLTSILPGITRECIITISRDLGFEVREERFSRDEIYIADEVFFTGTAAEVTPVVNVDGRRIGSGKPGPVTSKIQKMFFEVARGMHKEYEHWLTYL